jgi:hypothetical protein
MLDVFLLAMNMDNQLLIMDEPIESKIKPVEVEDFGKNTHHF